MGTSGFCAPTIRIAMPFDGFASVNLVSAEGDVVFRILEAERLSEGIHEIPILDSLPPGEYRWNGLVHRGVHAMLRGWADCSGGTPWETANGLGGWGGSGGVPSAVAADDENVFLGWDRAVEGAVVVALDAEDSVTWRWRSGSDAGCAALGVEDGVVFALMQTENRTGEIVRLNAANGAAAPWKDREENRLPIVSLWPADAKTKYRSADTLTVANGRIYLSFTEPGFIAVLDSGTGKYVTTISGPEVGPMALSTTPMRDPFDSEKMLVADFGMVTIASRAVSYFIMPHDPPWIAANSTRLLPEGERITALAMRGDTMESGDVQLYLGLDAPLYQVQARPATDPREPTFEAGRPGGRRGRGPWEPDVLGRIRAMAIDSRDRLWVAEGGSRPPRFSVWSTDGKKGLLLSEYFGPASPGALGGAIFPHDPDIMVGNNCEWRIDPESGRASCLGVIPGREIVEAQFAVAENGRDDLSAKHDDGSVSVFERIGQGEYRLRARASVNDAVATFWTETSTDGETQSGESVEVAGIAEDDLGLAPALGLRFGNRLFEVERWSETGAPFYGAMEAIWDSGSFKETAARLSGMLSFPKPLGEVSVYALEQGGWRFVNEAGLVVAKLFDTDAKGIRSPEKAEPGTDMGCMKSGASNGRIGGSIVQAIDGRVFAQAGLTAYWNMEITGLDSVESLPGGRIRIGEKETP